MNTTIEIEEGSTSSDSCRLEDIVDGIRFLTDSDKVLSDLVDEFDNTDDCDFIYSDICNRLDEISPEDMIFGSQDGDGACFGFWKIDMED